MYSAVVLFSRAFQTFLKRWGMRTAGLKFSMASNSYTPTKSPFGILQRHVKIYPLLHAATRVATPTICNVKLRSVANKMRGIEREMNGSERL